MLIQVIHCHPLADSYTALFRTITAALEDKGHEVAATDLYREQFDPAMGIGERPSERLLNSERRCFHVRRR